MTRNFFFPKRERERERKKERKKESNRFPAVENKDRGKHVGYIFRIRQIFVDFIVVVDDGRGSCMDGDFAVTAMMIMMTSVSHTLDKPSYVGHAKINIWTEH
jgi:hypothetical protein